MQEDDRNILELLSSQNNEMFLRYFKSNLKKLILSQYADKGLLQNSRLPEDYLVNHISSAFVETVSWWLSRKMTEFACQKVLRKLESGMSHKIILAFVTCAGY